MEQWYYARQGNQAGPVSRPELQSMAQRGELSPQDLVWTEGMAQWQPAQSVPGLLTSAPAASAAPFAVHSGSTFAPGVAAGVAALGYRSGLDQPAYAGFWRRLVALIIDAVLTGIVFGIVAVALHMESNGISIVGNWLYFAFMESSPYQATLGKLAMGSKVTDMDGGRIGFGKATGRYFGKILSAILLCVGFIMAAFTLQKQALHDILAGCLVVQKEP